MYAKKTMGYDLTFDVNDFNEPKLMSEIETVKNVLLFVLFAKPGQYPSLPKIGMDIEQYLYSFYDELDENDLKSQIVSQCQLLDQYISDSTIEIKKEMYKGQPSLIINVNGTIAYPRNYKWNRTEQYPGFQIGITIDEDKQLQKYINYMK